MKYAILLKNSNQPVLLSSLVKLYSTLLLLILYSEAYRFSHRLRLRSIGEGKRVYLRVPAKAVAYAVVVKAGNLPGMKKHMLND
jgi:hypothetical protein